MTRTWTGILASVAVGALVVLAPTRPATAGTPAGLGEQVSICHFAGHAGDFVTFNAASPGNNPLCDIRGGNAITVGRPACKNGHQAAAIPQAGSKDCDTTDQQ